jgi:exodeoxyribonuclease V beta subunit
VALTRARGRLYLPEAASQSNSAWRLVEDRLGAVGLPSPGFELRELEATAVLPDEERPPTGWVPEPALLVAAPDPRPRLAALARGHAGRLLTSYTRIRRGEPEADGDDRAEVIAPTLPPLAPGELPGGKGSGILLHRLLEEVDPATLRAVDDSTEWITRGDIPALGARIAAEQALAPATIPVALRMVWSALRTPIDLDGLVLPGGLAEAERRAVEMELVFPIPEEHHPRLGEAVADDTTSPPFRAERGFVQGVVDLVFEHGGRTYFVDWKSDRLAAFDAASLRAHVDEHYALQAQLYAVGVLRLLGLADAEDHAHRFGGLLYCFLRGMEPGGAGIHFERPGWAELLDWEEQLRKRVSWGAA